MKRYVLGRKPWEPFLEPTTGAKWVLAPSTWKDNEFLAPGYEQNIIAATATDTALREAWLYNNWFIAAGAFFAGCLDEKRVIEPFDPKSILRPHGHYRADFQLYLSHDFGSSAPSVTFVCAETPGCEGPDGKWFPRGSILLLDEFASNEPGSLTKGMGYLIPTLSDRIKELAKRWQMRMAQGVADDSIFARHGGVGGSIAEEFRRNGVYFRPAKKADRRTGWKK
jgi:hypothetical protein